MTDKTALPDSPNSRSNPDDGTRPNIVPDTENGVGEGQSDPRPTIFDVRFAKLTDGFGQACEQEGVTVAIAIAIHPEEKHPIIFIRGHQYDVATLTAGVLRELTRELMAPLNPNPNYRDSDGD